MAAPVPEIMDTAFLSFNSPTLTIRDYNSTLIVKRPDSYYYYYYYRVLIDQALINQALLIKKMIITVG
jgi:hypothetical protein